MLYADKVFCLRHRARTFVDCQQKTTRMPNESSLVWMIFVFLRYEMREQVDSNVFVSPF